MSGNIGGNSLQYDVIQQGGDPQYGVTDTSFQNCSQLGGGKRKQKRKRKSKNRKVRRSRRSKGRRTKHCRCRVCRCKTCKCTKKRSRMTKRR